MQIPPFHRRATKFQLSSTVKIGKLPGDFRPETASKAFSKRIEGMDRSARSTKWVATSTNLIIGTRGTPRGAMLGDVGGLGCSRRATKYTKERNPRSSGDPGSQIRSDMKTIAERKTRQRRPPEKSHAAKEAGTRDCRCTKDVAFRTLQWHGRVMEYPARWHFAISLVERSRGSFHLYFSIFGDRDQPLVYAIETPLNEFEE